MVRYWAILFIQRLLYPIILALCIFVRPVALSIPNLLLLLWLPFVPLATKTTFKAQTGIFFIIGISVASLTMVLQIAYQVTIFFLPTPLETCGLTETIMRHVGMISVVSLRSFFELLWFIPDIVMMIVSVGVFVILRALSAHQGEQNSNQTLSMESIAIKKQFGTCLAMVMLLLAAAIRPSVPSALYFIVFLGASTWWACFKELDRAFAIICRIVLAFLAVHFTVFLCYQTPYPQEIFPANSTSIRFLGLDPLVISNCSVNDSLQVIIEYNRTVNADSYLNPVAIIICYFTLAISSGLLLDTNLSIDMLDGTGHTANAANFSTLENGGRGSGSMTGSAQGSDQPRLSRQVSLRVRRKQIVRKVAARDTWHDAADKIRVRRLLTNGAEPTERTPLMNRGGKTFGSLRTKKTSAGTDVLMNEIGNRPQTSNAPTEDMPPTLCEHLIYGMGQVSEFLFKNSYILNNIIMMVWSIVYHSWITFVFLVWANLLWVIPNQRKNMMRCAPFVVFYAEFLLLAQYLYGMNLTEAELPSVSDMKGINMAQIGFVRYGDYPCQAILLKTLFTVAFWVTMRQRFYEHEIRQQSSTLAHLAAPIQVSVNAATTDLESAPKDNKSKPFNRIAQSVKQLLLQLWIWVVVLALFLCAIYGQRMTAFRIIYMTLFLSFLICFQLAWRAWAKLMYAFWVVVIGFAMCTLLMIYTYQFDRFNEIWANYLHIPESLQQDMGLEKFQTKDLFLHLLNPTLVVIITVVQLQIFHEKYLAQLDFTTSTRPTLDTSSAVHLSAVAESAESPLKDAKDKRQFQLANVANMTSKSVGSFVKKQYMHFKWMIEVLWLIVEMHLPKLILIFAFTLSVNEVSVLHFTIAVLAVAACATRSALQAVLTRLISLVVGVLLIVKMIYQVQYIDHSKMDVNCTNTTPNHPVNDPINNNANWFGLYKKEPNQQFSKFIEGYIWFIIVTTVYSIICLRQKKTRFINGQPIKRPKIIFPEITRDNADESLNNMTKFLFNYSFYKFGIELSLIMMVILIGHRMDLIALLYVIWLTVLFCMGRRFKVRAWPVLKWFIVVLTLVQYVALVGWPPFLCYRLFTPDTPKQYVHYLKPLVDWAFIPNVELRQQSQKLIMDFWLFMFVCRQLLVFRIEQQSIQNNVPYPGGSNKSVIEDIHHMNTIPRSQAHDFITYICSWLDIAKCLLFLGSFWLSLAIVFLTGTNRVSLFSVGYLVGSFIFLWQGTEFYLRPIHTIIRWWKHLIRWNLLVIACKVIMQVPSCVLIDELNSLDWLRQLFGMGCIQKYDETNDSLGELDAGLLWDGVCFAVLSFELRIFQSYYFCHIINESKANTILASRGAELIEALRRKEVKIQGQLEAEILQKIKQKMDRIKANQRKFQPTVTHPKTHYEDNVGLAPLARATSMSSCAGYHTPIEDELAGASDLPSDIGARGTSFLSTQAPSPMSAVLTVSLEGYLDDKRMSYGSPPGSDLIVPHAKPCSEESFPVFSPLPVVRHQIEIEVPSEEPSESMVVHVETPAQTQTSTTTTTTTSHTLQPGGVQMRQHRRQSSINTVSWTDQGDSSSARPLSYNLDPSDEADESDPAPVTLRRRPSHRRQSSVAISWSRFEDPGSATRRDSYASWMRDDPDADFEEMSTRTGRTNSCRPSSWGPVGEFFYRESLCLSETDRSLFSHHTYTTDMSPSSIPPSITSHQRAVRSGDYYLFDDLGEKVELDLMDDKVTSAVTDEHLKRRMSTRRSLKQVLAEKKRQRSLLPSDSSAPRRRPSLPEEHASVGVDPRSTASDPMMLGLRSGSDSEFKQFDGQKPGPSHEDPPSPPPPKDQTDGTASEDGKQGELALSGFAFVMAFLSGMVVTITLNLYKISRNYRYVMRVLAREKMELKKQDDFGKGQRVGTGQIWAPMPTAHLPAIHDAPPQSGSSSSVESATLPVGERDTDRVGATSDDTGDEHQSAADDEIIQQSDGGPTIARLLRPSLFSTKAESTKLPEEDQRTNVLPAIRIMAASRECGLDDDDEPSSRSVRSIHEYDSDDGSSSSTDSALVEMSSDDFYSREHSMATEFATAVWYALMANTDLLCYVMVFINMVASASILALPIPIMVFLWGTLTVPRPSKTFWVTLIAYTQVVVLIKCVCQLKIVWWHQEVVTSNYPLAPARIIGIEQKAHYAAYDLALLLIIFFHRFVQKQMGIWRSVATESDIEGVYSAQIDPPPTDAGFFDRSHTEFEKAVVNFEREQFNSSNSIFNEDTISEDLEEYEELIKAQIMFTMIDGIEAAIVKQGELTLTLTRPNKDEDDSLPGSQMVHVTSDQKETAKYFPSVAALSTKKYCSSFTKFFDQLLKPVSRVTVDLYVYIFLCDFINFFVLLFGFTAFGSTQGDGGVASYVEENKIPVAFLIMLLLQFVFIIVDRALYLRKNLTGKIIFQFVTVVGMHIWLFFLVPMFSERSFNASSPPVMFYIVKCFYFLFSAFQIRCGYPRRILGNCLTKGFSMLNLGAFKLYMALPFLFELRALMDWIWTESSMPLFEWLKMEDIFANIYELKCSRQLELDFPAARGQAKPSLVKYIMGGAFLFIIIAVVWGPLALFALGNTVGTANIPYEVQVELRIGSFEPIYKMTAHSNKIQVFNEKNWEILKKQYGKNKAALTFLSNFESDDVAAVELGANSTSLWIISPPDLDRLIDELLTNNSMQVRYQYSVSRTTYSDKMMGTISAEPKYELKAGDPAREGLVNMLRMAPDNNTVPVVLPNLFPKFLKAATDNMKNATELWTEDMSYYNLMLKSYNVVPNVEDMIVLKWYVAEVCDELADNGIFKCQEDKSYIYLFSLQSYSNRLVGKMGIIGIYTSVVLLISRFVRSMFADNMFKIIYVEIPQVDYVFQLCMDLYLVKNLGDLKTIPQMFPPNTQEFHRNLTVRMHHNNRSDMYWETLEKCDDPFYINTLSKLPFADCTNSLVLYTVSDKLFPPTLSWLTAGGVIGIYSTFVFLASRFFRGLFSGGSANIMFSELPYVDRILQLCLDIYLVRESLEFALEEDLFAKLIFLYRSPETMIKWTRPAEEQTDEDATDADEASGVEDDDNDHNGLRKRSPKNSSEA